MRLQSIVTAESRTTGKQTHNQSWVWQYERGTDCHAACDHDYLSAELCRTDGWLNVTSHVDKCRRHPAALHQHKQLHTSPAISGWKAWNPSQSYGASRATWDHTVLPATRHRWTCPTLTSVRHAGTVFTYPGWMKGWVDLGSWLYTEMQRGTNWALHWLNTQLLSNSNNNTYTRLFFSLNLLFPKLFRVQLVTKSKTVKKFCSSNNNNKIVKPC